MADFARKAKSQEWLDFFDVLLGSLISLLRRIHSIHQVIMEAIETTNESNKSDSIVIPEKQLEEIKSTSKEVLINVCDQVADRSSKYLTQRSKQNSAKLITTTELCKMGNLVELFGHESTRMTGKVSSGLVLSLQGQNILYIQAYHESKHQLLNKLLEREKWKISSLNFEQILSHVADLPVLADAFGVPAENCNGVNNNNSKSVIVVEGQSFVVPDVGHEFTMMLADYCHLCALLPSISVELGLKTAEMVKFYNSKICQLIIGAGAISVSGLKTITVRNLALAQRTIQLVTQIIPHVLKHFESCHLSKNHESVSEAKQFETFRKQFEQTLMHLKNHSHELEVKILMIIESLITPQLTSWQPSNQIPSKNFKDLCRQLTKFHESIEDIWTSEAKSKVMTKVQKFLLTNKTF